jgi:hypothetical protein
MLDVFFIFNFKVKDDQIERLETLQKAQLEQIRQLQELQAQLLLQQQGQCIRVFVLRSTPQK